MSNILKIFFSMSLSGSLLILAVLALRPLLRNRVSKSWQYYIWLVVIARLLLPFAPRENLMGTVAGYVEQKTADMEEKDNRLQMEAGFEAKAGVGVEMELEAEVGVGAETGSEAESGAETGSGMTGEFRAGGAGETALKLTENLRIIWLSAALILFVRKLTLYQSFVKYVKDGRREVTDIVLLDRLAQVQEQLKIKRPVELWTNGMVSTPMLIGFFHPCIVLPTAELPDREFQLTVWHELTHYRRGDLFYKWLIQITICLHWFNPLVHLMGREVSRACELACDEAVIRRLNGEQRRAYGDTLLHAMGAGGNCRNAMGTVTLNESAELLKERLGAIMNFKRTTKRMRLCAILISAVLLAGAAATGAYAGPPEKGDGDASFRYTQEGYYQPPYLFEIGWNVREDVGDSYESAEISLPDGSKMRAFFTDECDHIWEDEAVIAALTKRLAGLKEAAEKTAFPLTCPLVVSVQYIGEESPADLVQKYYQEESLPQFAAVFAQLTEKEQETFLQKIYGDGRIAFFSAALRKLVPGSALTEEFAEKAYRDGRISFFSVLVGYMDQKTLEEWAARAKEDGRTNFRAVLYDVTGQGEKRQDMEAELDTRRLEAYREHGITKEGNAYFYQGEMVKILLDARPDRSVATLEQNPNGKVNVRITRDEKGEITGVGYMTQEETAELMGDMAAEDEELSEEFYEPQDQGAPENGAKRLKKEELSADIVEAMERCDDGTWYVLCDGEKQYIYCADFGWEYAWEPERYEDGWQLEIYRISRKDRGYVLIGLPDDVPVRLTCDGETVSPELIKR